MENNIMEMAEDFCTEINAYKNFYLAISSGDLYFEHHQEFIADNGIEGAMFNGNSVTVIFNQSELTFTFTDIRYEEEVGGYVFTLNNGDEISFMFGKLA